MTSNIPLRDLSSSLRPTLTQPSESRHRTQRSASFDALIAAEHLEIAARERTFDGAYMRTALNCLATGIFIYRIFFNDFAPIAVAYLVFGVLVLILSSVRRFRIFKDMWKHATLSERLFAEEQATIYAPLNSPGDLSRPLDMLPGPVTSSVDRIASMQNKTQEVIEHEAGLKVTVPETPPVHQLHTAYFQWRRNLDHPPVPPVFRTSGGTVLTLSLLTLALELVVFVLLLRLV